MNILKLTIFLLVFFCIDCENNLQKDEPHPTNLCKQNQELKDLICQCKNGFYRIKEDCKKCDENSYYDIDKELCVCNYGYYQNSDKCNICHENCAACTGAGFQNCINCADNSFTFDKGECIKSTCGSSEFLSRTTGKCQQCSQNCLKCTKQICEICIQDYDLIDQLGTFKCIKKQIINKKVAEQKIEDKPQNQNKTDTGRQKEQKIQNKVEQVVRAQSKIENIQQSQFNKAEEMNNDKESGIKIIQDFKNFSITQKNGLRNEGTVYIAYVLSGVPSNLLKNNCEKCDKIIKIKMTQSLVIPGIKIWHLPQKYDSNIKILLQFSFNMPEIPPPFSYQLSLQSGFSSQFNKQDMNYILPQRIDPAILAVKQENSILEQNLEDLNQLKLNLSEQENNYLFQ